MLPRIFLPADQPVGGGSAWAGANPRIGARAQPPDIADVLLHETAIAGLRELIFKSTPVKPWEETAERFAARL